MAPLKFEDKIKEKLEQRTIKPSDNTWERLTSDLDEKEDEKKGISKTWFYAVAASLVGILIITTFFTKDNETIRNTVVEIENPVKKEVKNLEVVENKKETLQELKKVEDNNIEVGDSQNIRTEVVTSKSKSKIAPRSLQSENHKETEVVLHEKMKINEIEVAESVNNKKEIETDVSSVVPNELINDKVAGVVAQVKQMEKENIEVTEEEINKLLQKAQREITSERIINANKVSATALLQDVEAELDETFKERVFDALKTGFQKVKTAVAERNQ